MSVLVGDLEALIAELEAERDEFKREQERERNRIAELEAAYRRLRAERDRLAEALQGISWRDDGDHMRSIARAALAELDTQRRPDKSSGKVEQ